MRKRNSFATALLAAAIGCLAPPGPVAAQPAGLTGGYETHSLGDGLYAFRYGPYRNIFLVGSEGVIATDPLRVDAARAMRSEIARITDKPVRYVAYSHSHWDHAVGGAIFKREGATFVAQEKCRGNMRETPHPDVVEPDVVFTDRYEIKLGDIALELHYFGPTHSNCLSVMIAKPANMLFFVDLVSPPSGWIKEFNPTLPDTAIHNIIPYLKAVEQLMAAKGVKTIVGGHISIGRGADGKPMLHPPTGPASVVSDRREFWEALLGVVKAEMDKGTVGEMVAEKLAGSEFESKIVDYDRGEMAILYRVVASYLQAGRP